MKTILKKQATLYIILISITMLSTSNALTTQSNNNPTNNTSIKNNFDTKEYGNCHSNYTSTTARFNGKEYIINPTDKDNIKKEQASIKDKNNSIFYIFQAAGVSCSAVIINPLIENIFRIDQKTAKLTGFLIGAASASYIYYLIFFDYENKSMHAYLEQKQTEHKEFMKTNNK